nr:hypothetical protein [Nocardioides marinisabuli]
MEGPGRDDARDLDLADALDLGQRQPDAPRPPVGDVGAGVGAGGLDPLDDVGPLGGVDVEAEHRHAEAAGVLEDQPLGVHPRVVGQHPGQEVRRPVRLEPGRLVGRQRERGRVGLAEAEGGEGLQDAPHLLDHAERVAATQGAREEPGPGLGHPLRVAEGPALLVGLGVGDAGEAADDLDDLLVEDHHAAGRGQDRAQVVVEVARLAPAVLDLEVGRDHVALDRPGPEERDVGDDVLEGLDAGLADQLSLARRLDLEDPEGAGRGDHPVGRGVVEGHLLVVLEVDAHPLDALDLGEGVRHRRLHPDAEHVELEQAEVLDVVLVELAHREAGVRCLHGGAVEQGRVGEQHPAGVHRDVARQPVEALDELEHQVEAGLAQPAGAQLGQLGQRGAGVAGPDVGEGLGDGVGLGRGHPERGADVAHGVAHPVGVHHRDAHAPLAAVAVEDALVDLGAPVGLDVDVDVGQRLAQRGEEALHQQLVADRVDPGDAEQVVDQAAGPRAARGDPHAHLLDQVGDVADGQEVRGVAELADHRELVLEPLPHHRQPAAAVAVADGALAARAQRDVGAGVVGGEAELGEVHLPQAQVGARVERAALRQGAGARQQAQRLAPGAGAGAGHDLVGHLAHLGPGLQVPLGVAAVDVATVEGDQAPGGVEHVDGGGVAAVGVAHGVGQHRPRTDLLGQREHPGGVPGRAGAVAGQAVRDHLDLQVLAGHQGAPALQGGAGVVAAALGRGGPDLGGRAEQHDQVAGGEQRRDLGGLGVQDRGAALAGEVGGREHPAQRGPAAPSAAGPGGVGQQGDPRQPRVAEGAAPHRGAPAPRHGRRRPGAARPVGQVDPEHRADPGLQARLGELHRPVGAVAVGERQQVHAVVGGALHQQVRQRGAVLQGVARGDVQVRERVGHGSDHLSRRLDPDEESLELMFEEAPA